MGLFSDEKPSRRGRTGLSWHEKAGYEYRPDSPGSMTGSYYYPDTDTKVSDEDLKSIDVAAEGGASDSELYATGTKNVAQRQAEQQPVYQWAQEKGPGWLESVTPEAYREQAQQLGAYGERYGSMTDEALARQRGIAMGDESIALKTAELQKEALRRALSSELASATGGYNPALQRASMMATSRGMSDIGARAAVAAAQEQRDMISAYEDALQKAQTGRQAITMGEAKLTGLADTLAMTTGMLPQQIESQQFAELMSAINSERQLEMFNANLRAQAANQPSALESFFGAVSSLAPGAYYGGKLVKDLLEEFTD